MGIDDSTMSINDFLLSFLNVFHCDSSGGICNQYGSIAQFLGVSSCSTCGQIHVRGYYYTWSNLHLVGLLTCILSIDLIIVYSNDQQRQHSNFASVMLTLQSAAKCHILWKPSPIWIRARRIFIKVRHNPIRCLHRSIAFTATVYAFKNG